MQRTAMRMSEFIRASRSGTPGAPGAPGTLGIVASQPWWVVRTSMIAFVLVAAIPLVIVFVAATLASVIVFFVLAMINFIMQKLGMGEGGSGGGAGRENVRVIPPDGDST